MSVVDDNAVLVVIERRSGWIPIDWREMWRYRELLGFLTWRDIKVRYKQAALGAAWAVIQPLFSMLLFTLFFGRLAKLPSDGIPYPVFSYAALLPWTFFANAVSGAGNSLVNSSNLLTKVYFPRLMVPGAVVLAGLADFAIASIVLVGLLFWYGIHASLQMLLFPLLVTLTAVLALGIGLWAAAMNVRFRDVRHALPFVMQLWMFASPVIYPSSLMSAKWRWILELNPMTGIIESFRASLLGRPIPWNALGYSTAIAGMVLAYSAYSFRRLEREFADIV